MSHETLFPDSYNEKDKIHSIWWKDQMQVCKDVLHEIVKEISEIENAELAGSHTSTNDNGKHDVKVSFKVEGESFKERLEEEGDQS